jgi:hypothetical protein
MIYRYRQFMPSTCDGHGLTARQPKMQVQRQRRRRGPRGVLRPKRWSVTIWPQFRPCSALLMDGMPLLVAFWRFRNFGLFYRIPFASRERVSQAAGRMVLGESEAPSTSAAGRVGLGLFAQAGPVLLEGVQDLQDDSTSSCCGNSGDSSRSTSRISRS